MRNAPKKASILALLEQGLPYREIQKQVGCSKGTISNYVVRNKRFARSNNYDYCYICWNKGEWNEKPLNLISYFLNGNFRDFSKKNYVKVCPNCKSQLKNISQAQIPLN
jgi:hypothetical protein